MSRALRVRVRRPLPASLAAALAALEDDGRVRVTIADDGAATDAERGEILVLSADDPATLPLLSGLGDAPAPRLVLVHGTADAALAALGAGADLWLDAAEPAGHLAARIGALLRRAGAGAPPAPLSGDDFAARIEHEFDRARRYRRSVALLALAGGPLAADLLPALLRPLVRDVDTLGTVGGRCAVLLPETDARGAVTAAERLRGALGAGAAVGLAAFPARGIETAPALRGRALEALAQALRPGGKGIVAFGDADVIWSREAPQAPAP